MKKILGLFLLVLAGGLSLTLENPGWAEENPPADPFILELPDFNLNFIREPTAFIPSNDVHKVRIRIQEPFASSIEYHKITIRINGEASGPIQTLGSGSTGKWVDCDLDRFSRFKFKGGKNVVEVKATDQKGSTFYASYVLTSRSDFAPGSAGSVVYQPVSKGSDQTPPTIFVTEPRGAATVSGFPATLKISGSVTDDSGTVTELKINQKSVPLNKIEGRLLSQGKAARNDTRFEFALTVQVESAATPVILEAKDGAGNLTKITIPVLLPSQANAPIVFTGQKYALLIGVSQYQNAANGVRNLQFADADARSLRDFLLSEQGGKFAPANVTLLENAKATTANVRSALDRLKMQAGPNDLVFLFIGGHGGPDPVAKYNLYFVMYESSIGGFEQTALPMTEVQQVITKELRAQRVVALIDTCHSAGMTSSVNTRSLENNLVNLYAAKLFSETGRAILTSSDVNEVSQESTKWGNGHGVFTWALLDGLNGAADLDKNNLVTTNELFLYTRSVVQAETGFQQNPRAFDGNNGNLVLSLVKK
ncbi:MAG: caspase family protein [Blastocatellia bacterium]|nr:caspase family protein [Blastocatellia bacterium]